MIKLLMAFTLMLNVTVANAHQTSTSFIILKDTNTGDISTDQKNTHTSGLWKVSINALNSTRPMDINNDGYVKWDEVKKQENIVFQLFKSNLRIAENKMPCSVSISSSDLLAIESILGMNYVVIPFESSCAINEISTIDYTFYFGIDNDHKAVITLVDQYNKTRVAVLSSEYQRLELRAGTSNSFVNIVMEGIWHIWKGYDHIIFLLTLIVGVLFVAKRRSTQELHSVYLDKQTSRQKIANIIKVVSAFTIAHSITLSLAALEIITIPVQIIEATIAATLVIAAIHNLRYLFSPRFSQLLSWSVWKMALIFGLFHGFGFANVLAEMNLNPVDLFKTLLAFNIGVEIGQIIIVSIVVSLLMLVAHKKYSNNRRLEALLPVSSVLVIVLGGIWFVERSFNIVVF